MKRRSVNAFSLAFLDVMFCGFGAVILFFMIINANTYVRRDRINHEVKGEVTKIDVEVLDAQKYLVELKNSLQETNEELVVTQGLSSEVIKNINQSKTQLAQYRRDTLATKENINELKTDTQSLEEEQKRLEGGAVDAESQGERLRQFAGQGQRQYLTGLKMGGERILILVDSSASMLADRIINVLRFRNLPYEEKILAPKWQQVLYTVDWITTRIPPSSQFQIYTFSETSAPVYTEETSEWLDGGNLKHLNTAVDNFYATSPEKGTSLFHAFKSIDELTPPPDNIYLLTDGLPTRGETKPITTKVSAKARKNHFRKALKKLPVNIPVNIILFNMEGDPDAPSEFWKLAQRTNGSFFSPSNDWP